MYKYIEIKSFDNGEVVKRYDVTNKNDTAIDLNSI